MRTLTSFTAGFLLFVSAQAAAFDLQDLSGKPTSIEALLPINQWTLVMLWSIDCVACEEQKPMIDAFHQDHHLSNAKVIGISTDGNQQLPSVQKHVKKRPVSFDNYVTLSDNFKENFEAATGKRFLGTPTYLLYDKTGTLTGAHPGLVDRGMLERIVGKPDELQVIPADLIR
jgi:thiol-disulfide isomerase/thioredoxin